MWCLHSTGDFSEWFISPSHPERSSSQIWTIDGVRCAVREHTTEPIPFNRLASIGQGGSASCYGGYHCLWRSSGVHSRRCHRAGQDPFQYSSKQSRVQPCQGIFEMNRRGGFSGARVVREEENPQTGPKGKSNRGHEQIMLNCDKLWGLHVIVRK